MTEAEWLVSTDPQAMLNACLALTTPGQVGFVIPGKVGQVAYRPSGRKLQLWHEECTVLCTCPGNAAWLLEQDVTVFATFEDVEGCPCTRTVKAALLRDIVGNPWRPWAREIDDGITPAHVAWEGKLRSVGMVHQMRGGPHILRVSWLAWNDRTVPRLAEAIYEGRRFEEMPILADALEEAGCENEELLRHCRGEERCHDCLRGSHWSELSSNGICPGWRPLRGPHVRGCWAVDLLLGKE